MKSLILMVVMFSMTLTAITILKYESSKLDLKIKTANDLKNKLQYEWSFLKSEWEYLSSPKNIENLSNSYLHLEHFSKSPVPFRVPSTIADRPHSQKSLVSRTSSMPVSGWGALDDRVHAPPHSPRCDAVR